MRAASKKHSAASAKETRMSAGNLTLHISCGLCLSHSLLGKKHFKDLYTSSFSTQLFLLLFSLGFIS